MVEPTVTTFHRPLAPTPAPAYVSAAEQDLMGADRYQHGLLRRTGIRRRHVGAGYPAHRVPQHVERLLGHDGGDRRSPPQLLRALLDDHRAPRLGDPRADRHGGAESDERHIGAFAEHRGLAEWDDVLAIGHVALDRVQRPGLEHDHRIVVQDRRGHLALELRGRGRHGDLDARRRHHPALGGVTVLAAESAAATGRALDHKRRAELAAGAVPHGGDLVDDEVPAHGKEGPPRSGPAPQRPAPNQQRSLRR